MAIGLIYGWHAYSHGPEGCGQTSGNMCAYLSQAATACYVDDKVVARYCLYNKCHAGSTTSPSLNRWWHGVSWGKALYNGNLMGYTAWWNHIHVRA